MKDTNNQITIGELPSLEDIDWVNMNPNLIVRDVIRNGVIGLFQLVAIAVFGFLFLRSDLAILQIIGIIAIFIGIVWVVLLVTWPRLEFPHRGYALREMDIAQKHGLVNRFVATAPFSRVQHVAVTQGLLDRMFSLATLQIYTAGGVSSIKGFYVDHAHTLREHILEMVAQINRKSVEELEDEVEQNYPSNE